MRKNEKLAKYQIIKRNILKKIRSGKLQPGDKVDSESVLRKKYDVSAITVRKAFSELIGEGFLVGIKGAGTFVAKKQMIRGLTSLSFSEELRQQGYQVDMILDSITLEQNEVAADNLGLSEDSKLTRIARVRLANGEPVAYHISYLPPDLISVEQAEEIRKARSLYAVLSRHKIIPYFVNEIYSVRKVTNPEICRRMNVKKNYASFFVKRSTFDHENHIIEYCETFFNSSFYSVTVNIRV